MAERVTIRQPDTGQERTVAKSALDFFPGWERVDSLGRKTAQQPATPNKES